MFRLPHIASWQDAKKKRGRATFRTQRMGSVGNTSEGGRKGVGHRNNKEWQLAIRDKSRNEGIDGTGYQLWRHYFHAIQSNTKMLMRIRLGSTRMTRKSTVQLGPSQNRVRRARTHRPTNKPTTTNQSQPSPCS